MGRMGCAWGSRREGSSYPSCCSSRDASAMELTSSPTAKEQQQPSTDEEEDDPTPEPTASISTVRPFIPVDCEVAAAASPTLSRRAAARR